MHGSHDISPSILTPYAAKAKKAADARYKRPPRRLRIDPTTTDRQYTDDEVEFMNAMQRYIDSTGDKYPLTDNPGAVLEVARSLGYRKRSND